jgi:ParB family transcriptional regulator, chromosome partitioning protein
MASKLFGGIKLSEVAKQIKEKGDPSPYESSPARPVMPAAELALTGRTSPMAERTSILSVDPKRCRPWKFHNRSNTSLTKEGCQDLIDSIPRDGQLEPALARKTGGDPDFDFELIYGMRRRFAAEFTHTKLKVRLTDADDARCAVLMHIENADRQDITPMERALSFQQQLEAKIFSTQESMAEAFGLGSPQITKLLKAAQLFRHTPIAQLFADRSAVPVTPAYELVTLMERPGAKEIVLKAAQNLLARGEGARTPAATIKHLAGSLDRSKRIEPLKREYNVGTSTRMTVVRNPKGKVTMAFPKGLRESDREGLLAAIDKVLKDLG